MTWENIVKKKKLIGGQKKLDKDNDGDIDAEDFASMRMEKQADCRVTVCDATDCGWNSNRKCTRGEITINSSGECIHFPRNSMAGNVGANLGSRGLIDRAKRNLQEEKRTR